MTAIGQVLGEKHTGLVRDALAIGWLIYMNGGIATKSAVEDVLMLRHEGLDRTAAHDITNLIEYYDLSSSALRTRTWDRNWGDPPSLAEYPEILQAHIRWPRGNFLGWAAMVISRMKADGIKDFSEAEIQRVFADCVTPKRLTEAAHQLIDAGYLTLAMVGVQENHENV